MHEVVDRASNQAILGHGQWDANIDIIPMVISRTGSFHVKTLAKIAQLVSFEEEPPTAMKYTDLPPAAKHIAMALHTHAQHWLALMLKLSKAMWP